MRRYTTVVIAGMLASLMLAAAVGTASARNLEVSNQRIRAQFNRLSLAAEPVNNVCEVTLEGSFHTRTIAKALGSLIGYVTRVDLNRCTFTTRILELPWHIRYLGFTGTLPRIETIRINLVGPAFLVDAGIGRCLFRSEDRRAVGGSIVLNRDTGQAVDVTSFRSPVPLFRNLGGICPANGTLNPTPEANRIFLLGTTTLIFVRLI